MYWPRLQVTSYNDSPCDEEAAPGGDKSKKQRTGEGASGSGETSGGGGGHIALNYWFHPPDTATAEAPYTTDLWARDFSLWRELQQQQQDS